MHVNYLENAGIGYPDTFRMCADAGYDGIEVRDRDRAGHIPLNEYLPMVYEGAVAAGLQITFGCRNNSVDEDSAVRQQELENFLRVIVFAGERGIKVLNVFAGLIHPREARRGHPEDTGSCVASEEHWQRTVDYFHVAADAAAAYDMVLAFETHAGYIHDLAAPSVELIKRVDRANVRVNFDFGNIYLHPENQGLEGEIRHLGPQIAYVHLKNVVSLAKFGVNARFATPLADGDINNYVLLRTLFATGYQGILAIENTMPGDKRPLMAKDLNYLKDTVATLTSG